MIRFIYILRDPISMEPVYVGETSNPTQRSFAHKYGCKKDSYIKQQWLASLKALGEEPIFELMDTAENKREALIKENELIVELINSGASLFNINNSETIKQYDSTGKLVGEFADGKSAFEITGILPRIDRYSAGGFQWSYGLFNPELINRYEEARKVLCRPVQQINKRGEVLAEYDGVRIACNETGIDHRSISQAAIGSRKTAGGYIWKYKYSKG